MTMLLYILIISFTSTQAQTITRQNVGVIYEQLPGRIVSGHDKHQIIIAVPYDIPNAPTPRAPIYPQIKSLQKYLHTQDETTVRLDNQAKDIDILIATTEASIHSTLANIRHFLSDPITNTRPKRAIFGFLGDLFKSVFGLATTHDVDSLISTVKNLDSILTKFATTDSKTAQLIHKLTARQDNIIQTYVQDYNTLSSTISNISQTLEDWTTQFSSTIHTIQSRQDMLREQIAIIATETVVSQARLAFHHGLASIENSLRLLSTGILAPDMIQPADLANKLKELDIMLRATNPGSQVAVMDTAYYYSQPVTVYTYSHTHLYIHLDIIIAATDADFTLYQIITLEIPVDTSDYSSNKTTKLQSDYTYIAVNDKRDVFMELNTNDIQSCRGHPTRICSRTFPRRRANPPTCQIAIFINIQDKITSLCNFIVKHNNHMQTNAIATNKNTYLIVTTEPFYHIICQHNTPEKHKAHPFIHITVPCYCHLQFSSLYLPNTLVPCNTTLSTHTVAYPANFPLIATLSHINTHVTTSSFHTTPVTIPTLHLHIDNHKTDMTKLTDTSLTEFVNTLLTDTRVEEQEVLDAQNTPTTSASNWYVTLWSYADPILTVANSIVLLLIVFKYATNRPLFTALPMASATPLNITWKSRTTNAPTTSYSTHLSTYLDSQNLLTILLLVLTIYIIYKCVKRCKRTCSKHFGYTTDSIKTNPTVTLKIYHGDANYTVPLLTLPHEMDAIQEALPPHITNINTTLCPHPTISITYSGPLSITTPSTTKTYYLPEQCILPFRCRYTVIPAIRDPTTTTALILKTNTNVRTLTPPPTDQDELDNNDQENHEIHQDPTTMSNFQLITALLRPRVTVGNEN